MNSPQTQKFLARYADLGFSGEPCSSAEVQALEHQFQIRLPAAYRAFLLFMGRRPDESFDGSDCAYRHLAGLRTGAERLLLESGQPFSLRGQDFTFFMHQGYQFLFFPCDDASDDPPVYHYLEQEPATEKVYERFSDWMAVCAKEKREGLS